MSNEGNYMSQFTAGKFLEAARSGQLLVIRNEDTGLYYRTNYKGVVSWTAEPILAFMAQNHQEAICEAKTRLPSSAVFRIVPYRDLIPEAQAAPRLTP